MEEYRHIGENMRHFANLRFTLFVTFIVTTLAFCAIIFCRISPIDSIMRNAIEILGICFTLCVWIMESRFTQFWIHHNNMIIELEKKSDAILVKQYSSRPAPKSTFSVTKAMRCMFCIVLLFWLLSIISHLCY